MEMIGKIRRMFFRDKKSLHEIAKRTSLSRNTIRKWIRSTEEVALPAYQRSPMPGKLTVFHESLEQALKADSLRHKHAAGQILVHHDRNLQRERIVVKLELETSNPWSERNTGVTVCS